jgi:hypothetical protein
LKLQNELFTVSNITQSGIPPTAEERKTLSHHMIRLEDILDGVDAVNLPTESAEEISTARRIRRQLVGEIVSAIDRTEKFIQPGTPSLGPEPGTSSVYDDPSDGEQNVLIDNEIQKVIRETLARKEDEDVVPRRSVTLEEVPDSEY